MTDRSADNWNVNALLAERTTPLPAPDDPALRLKVRLAALAEEDDQLFTDGVAAADAAIADVEPSLGMWPDDGQVVDDKNSSNGRQFPRLKSLSGGRSGGRVARFVGVVTAAAAAIVLGFWLAAPDDGGEMVSTAPADEVGPDGPPSTTALPPATVASTSTVPSSATVASTSPVPSPATVAPTSSQPTTSSSVSPATTAQLAEYQLCSAPVFSLAAVVHQLEFSPDGSLLAVTSIDGTAWLLDTTTGQTALTLRGHRGGVIGATFSPDSSRLVTSGSGGTARVWDTETGEQRAVIRHEDTNADFIFRVAFSADGRLFATAASDGTARAWNAESLEPVRVWRSDGGWIHGVAFNPADPSLSATAASDGRVTLWSTTEDEPVRVFDPPLAEAAALAFSPDGSTVAVTSTDGVIALWDTATGARLETLTRAAPGSAWAAAFSPDGTLLAVTGPGSTELRDTATGDVFQSIPGYSGDHYDVAFSPDGSALAVVNPAGRVELHCTS